MNVYYIDPQSYNNLSVYDHSLLSNVSGHRITYYYNDKYQLSDIPGDVYRCRFHYSRKSSTLAKALSYCLSICGILKDVLCERPDVVHIQWIRIWIVDYLFAWILVRLGVRVVFTAHNILPHVQHRNDHTHYRRYYHLVSDIIVHNSRTKDELVSMMNTSSDKVHVIFHGVLESNVTQSDVIRRSDEIRAELGIRPTDIVFACLGVQKPYKGTSDVIDVWSTTPALSDNPDIRLLIVGKNHGIDYSAVEHLSNVVIKDEMVTDLDFEAYLQLTSVVLLPYHRISQSGLLFSAICRNVPSLITDVGGLSEPLRYGRVGWNIGKPSIDALRYEMVRLSQSKTEIDKIKSDIKQFENVRSIYSWHEIGKATSDLYVS